MRGLGCFYREFCCLWTAVGTLQIGRVERLHLASCSSRTPRSPQTPASASPSPDSTWEESPLSGPKTLTLMKSITSHLDQCVSHAQPSPCTLTLVDPSQLLHIFGEIFQRPNQILPLSALRLVDAPKHAQERGSLSRPGPALPTPAFLAVSSPCPGHPVPTGPFLSILPVGRETESAWPRERTETESPGRFLSLSVPQFSHLQNGNKNQPHPEDGDGSREEPRKTCWTLDVCVTPGRLRIVGILVCLAHCCAHGVQHRAHPSSNLMSSC